MKKKLLAAMLCAAITLSLTACSKFENAKDTNDGTSSSDKTDKDNSGGSSNNDSSDKSDTDSLSEPFDDKYVTNEDFFSYTIEDGELIITKYTGIDSRVVIPRSIGGKPVTQIGSNAFQDCLSLTSVTIPDGVTSIGDKAFRDCGSLTSVAIPDSVKQMGGSAFTHYECIFTYKGVTYSSDDYAALYKTINGI